MANVNRQQTMPVSFPKSRRNHPFAVLTSMPAGRMVPLGVVPMLREDSLIGHHRINVEMLETAELLMNGVNLRVMAYCVPLLALERFQGSRDQFDRSYKGEPQIDGGSVIPFIETDPAGAHGANAVFKYLGLHAKAADEVNTAYLEAYNLIWNFRAKNRSQDLTPRARLADTLAPAFWLNSPFEHVVPNFDQAVIDGEVALNIISSRLEVKGMGFVDGGPPALSGGPATIKASDGEDYVIGTSGTTNRWTTNSAAANNLSYRTKDDENTRPDIWAELADNGVTVSLSNLALAKQTQAFAKLRERYDGIADEYIIDMLMDGLSIPDQALKQPILIADVRTKFGQAKRYATDSGNLAESAVSGGASVNIDLRVPRLNTGGVVMIVAEILPDQLFERQRDPFFHSANVDAWPEALRDTLDPEKVDVITNAEVDTDHATPAGVFGYEPMNAKWNRGRMNIGGKFYRPTTNTGTDTDRQRLWSIETVNPVLGADFYISSTVHVKPFLDLAVDPFEAVVVGNNVIEGNTQFGGMLVEATSPTASNYDDVLAKAPQDRITQV